MNKPPTEEQNFWNSEGINGKMKRIILSPESRLCELFVL